MVFYSSDTLLLASITVNQGWQKNPEANFLLVPILYFVTLPAPNKTASWVFLFYVTGFKKGSNSELVTNRKAKYLSSRGPHSKTLIKFRQYSQSLHALSTNNLVEVQDNDPGTHFLVFFHNQHENWSAQKHFCRIVLQDSSSVSCWPFSY